MFGKSFTLIADGFDKPDHGAVTRTHRPGVKATSDFSQRTHGCPTTIEGMQTTSQLLVHAADPARLDTVRTAGTDGHGNKLQPFAATGQGEPLRCCLRYAEPGEQIALISYAPFDHPSVWTEVGPVYIHAARCD